MYGNRDRCLFSINDERPIIEDAPDVWAYEFTSDSIESLDADFGYVTGCIFLRQIT
jgi:hypothetical protein